MEYLILEEDKPTIKPNKRARQRTKRKKRVSIICDGLDCPKCNRPMQRRKHSSITPKELKKAYYFSEWDYCVSCKHIQLYEKYKIWNNNEKSRRVWEYEEQQQLIQHFSSL